MNDVSMQGRAGARDLRWTEGPQPWQTARSMGTNPQFSIRRPLMTRALIIGGGIAGPVTAMALQRAGIDAVVYEAYAEGAGPEVGAFLGAAVTGLDALRTVGRHT